MKLLAIAFGFVLASLTGLSQNADPNSPGRNRNDYLNFALRREGNALRGKELFFNEQRLACRRCQNGDGTGGKAGPDLFAIGDKFGRRDLINSILEPSATIAVGDSRAIITTKAGDEIQGIIKQATDAWIELVGADAKAVRISAGDIAARKFTELSLMPEGLEKGLTLQEFADLTEYLVTLKQPESAALVNWGMPATIEETKKPVALRPYIEEGSKFHHPVWFGPVSGLTNAFLVLEHDMGRIWLLEKTSGGDRKSLFLDLGTNVISGGSRGLFGCVLPPRFAQNRKYYLALHIVENGQPVTMTVEREAAEDLRKDSGRPAREILRFKAATNVHYGGGLAFGPDTYLYIGMGDTGPQEDPQGHGQNMQLLLGKLMRLDVDHPAGDKLYRIPSDNPFAGSSSVLPEIWAAGFREPWRFSFDPLNGDLWVGDVGQDRYEEVDIVRKGENSGWNVYEGFERFSNRYRRDGEKFVPPVFAYARKYGPSVTGGYVYPASRHSPFSSGYIFGDYESRRIWGLIESDRKLRKIRQIAVAPQRVVSFGRDEAGELYVVGYEGMIYQLALR